MNVATPATSPLASAGAGVVRAASHLRGEPGRRHWLVGAPPGNTGGGLELAGPLQEWRRRSYAGSHVGPDS